MKKILTIIVSAVILAGCVTTGDGSPGESFRGEGEIVSIFQTDEGYSEVGVRTEDKTHVTVVVKEVLDLFPGEKVKINKRANGFGTVTRP